MYKIKILVLGITSNIGYKLFKEYSDKFDIYGTYRNLPSEINKLDRLIKTCDLSKKELSEIISKIKPDVVINCIALGNLDDCEINKENCKSLNFDIVKNLVDILKNLNIKLVHFSSNAIYDGKNAPYDENSKAGPVNNYGMIKLRADSLVQNNLTNYLLLRPITMISYKEEFQRENPASFIINKILKNQTIKLVNDDFVNFLYLDDLVHLLSILLLRKINGVFNISGDETLNRYQLGLKILKKIDSNVKIEECSLKEFNSKAKRAFNTTFNNNKIKNLINFKFTSIDTALDGIIKKTQD